MSIQKTVAEFSEGIAEIFVLAIISVMTKAFTSIDLPGANWNPLTSSLALVFVFSLIFNFLKGVFVPFQAAVNVAGMLFSLCISAAVIWRIAPDAVTELISYIIAAIIGIYIGVKIRLQGQDQDQQYYRF